MICINGDRARPFTPRFMVIPSLSCPAACRYCFGPNTGPAMRREDAARTVDFIRRIADETGQTDIRVTLHGGEPLAAGYPVLEALLTGLRNAFPGKRLRLSVQSNLWLLDKPLCALFAAHNVSIGTSLDGPRHLNDPQRGDGYFDRTMAGIRLARRSGLTVGVIATITRQTAGHAAEIFGFFAGQGLPFSTHVVSASDSGTAAFALPEEQHRAFFREAFAYYRESGDTVNMSTLNTLCRAAACGAGDVCTFSDCFGRFLVIGPTGELYSCTRFAGNPAFSLGNLADQPSAAGLLGCQTAARLLLRERQVAEACGGCEHYPYCKGGCPQSAYAEGTLISESFCHVYKDVFASVKTGLVAECAAEPNRDALARYGLSPGGSPLLRAGRMISFAKPEPPCRALRSASRVIAARELARGGDDVETAAAVLAGLGIGRSQTSLQLSLRRLISRIHGEGCAPPAVFPDTGQWAAPDYVEQLSFEPAEMKTDASAMCGIPGGPPACCPACEYRYLCGGLLRLYGAQPPEAAAGLHAKAEALYRYALSLCGARQADAPLVSAAD